MTVKGPWKLPVLKHQSADTANHQKNPWDGSPTGLSKGRKERLSKIVTERGQKMGNQGKHVSPIGTDYERRKQFVAPGTDTKVPGKALNEKRTKKLPRMKTKEEILQGIATLGRSGSDTWPDLKLLSRTPEMCQVMEDIEAEKNSRQHAELMEDLDSIKGRVKEALCHVEMYDVGEDLDEANKLPPIDSMETLKKRREMVNKEGAELEEGVKTYIGGCQERQDLLVDVDHWLSSIDLTSDLPAEAHIDQVSRHFWEVHRHVMLALNRYESLSEKVMEFGSSLLTTTNAMIQEKKENARDMAEGAKKKINVINERQLLADQKKWDSAVKMVMSTFEEAMKWTKNAAHQNLFKRGQMQFRELSYGMKKRNAELKMKGKAEEDAKLKLQKARAEVEEKAKEFENVRKNFRKLNAELEDKKQLLTMTMENNTNLSQKCQKQGVQIKELQKVMATQSETIERGKSASHPPHLLQASPPGSSPSSPRSSSPPHSARQGIEETVTESSAHVKLDQTEKELEEKVSIATLRKMKSEIRSLEGLLSKEKEKVRQMSLDKGETKRNDQSRQGLGQEIQRLKSRDEDSTSYKTPREHAVERERVEGHLNTERLRNVELVKGLEDRSRQQVTALQEDVLNVLRAVMRFKDHVCTIVEGENLKDAAEALKALGPNIPDTMTPDPKEMFDLLVGSVVEFMQNMEVAIADAFLSMREMIKKSKESKTTKSADVSRVEERNKKQMEDSKSEFKKIEFKLKIAKQRLIKFEQFKDKEKAQERKYFALLDRYRRIWKMYNNLNKDMAMLWLVVHARRSG